LAQGGKLEKLLEHGADTYQRAKYKEQRDSLSKGVALVVKPHKRFAFGGGGEQDGWCKKRGHIRKKLENTVRTSKRKIVRWQGIKRKASASGIGDWGLGIGDWGKLRMTNEEFPDSSFVIRRS
jgi:hypothetical protein